jgi:DNA-3-methyladenine glycosylase II
MFLIFSLCRKDVISLGDFGIRRGLSILYFDGQMPGREELAGATRRFSPCGTLASMYLWEVKSR